MMINRRGVLDWSNRTPINRPRDSINQIPAQSIQTRAPINSDRVSINRDRASTRFDRAPINFYRA